MIRKSATGNSSEPVWFKSSYSSGPDGDSCVEVAGARTAVHVRDSKHRTAGPRLTVAPGAWAEFVRAL
ncbi:DUF397 domain-containing protein [Streptomyces sp. MS06]|uniref:DUF397 domain-containing protein n=1 Tax=Streptomyces sp. MS06 TaxID=3385974 RepID=UPI0039A2A001